VLFGSSPVEERLQVLGQGAKEQLLVRLAPDVGGAFQIARRLPHGATAGATLGPALSPARFSCARAAGIACGVYHFFHVKEDPHFQAATVTTFLGGALAAGDLPPVIDIEAAQGQSKEHLIEAVDWWLSDVADPLGVVPIIYTGPSFWAHNVGDQPPFDEYPLWVAHYGVTKPIVPKPWTDWTFWQHTDQGRVPGIGVNVDLDVFNGDAEAFASLRRT
jgi:lysozyme